MNSIDTNHRFFTAIGAALLLTCVFAASSAMAGAGEAAMENVKYGDLNLNSDAGAKTLYRRIHVAAERVCAPAISGQLSLAERTRACVAQAESSAIEKVNAPRLSALYEQKTGKPVRTVVASN